MIRILMVDDEPAFLDSARRAFRLRAGTEVHTAGSGPAALEVLDRASIDLAFLDVTMAEMHGLELLARILERWPHVDCVMLTARDDVQTVMRATRLGANDYLVKPIVPDQLNDAVERAVERRRLIDLVALHADPQRAVAPAFAEVLTCDARMIRLLHEAELHARSDIPVLISGETGTGKELLARGIHAASARAKGPFVPVNMLALAPNLFESEFFGHKRGAFTGALSDREGYLHRARRGTLFLDEIGDLSAELQGKLLRILQEGEFTPVGATQPLAADVRFVAATHQDLDALVRDGKFRRDLLYRLRHAHLTLPPLRERADDILLLASSVARASARPDVRISEAAVAALLRHDWPGNVRELQGMVSAAANLAESGEIAVRHLLGLHAPQEPGERAAVTLAEMERRHILTAYEALGRNKTHTARSLGISIPTLVRKLRAYGED